MTKKRSSEIFGVKTEIFFEKLVTKFIPDLQTRRQVSAHGSKTHQLERAATGNDHKLLVIIVINDPDKGCSDCYGWLRNGTTIIITAVIQDSIKLSTRCRMLVVGWNASATEKTGIILTARVFILPELIGSNWTFNGSQPHTFGPRHMLLSKQI